jgi:hypothetical protein
LEGFSLPSGAAYLPDFFLPSLGVDVEIKPTEKLNYSDLKRMVEFALEGDHCLVLIAGSPTQEAMYLIDRCTCEPIEDIEGEFEEPLPEDTLISRRLPLPSITFFRTTPTCSFSISLLTPRASASECVKRRAGVRESPRFLLSIFGGGPPTPEQRGGRPSIFFLQGD